MKRINLRSFMLAFFKFDSQVSFYVSFNLWNIYLQVLFNRGKHWLKQYWIRRKPSLKLEARSYLGLSLKYNNLEIYALVCNAISMFLKKLSRWLLPDSSSFFFLLPPSWDRLNYNFSQTLPFTVAKIIYTLVLKSMHLHVICMFAYVYKYTVYIDTYI